MKQLNIFLMLILFAACEKEDNFAGAPNSSCGSAIEVNPDRADDRSDNFDLLAATVEGKCLEVTIATSGCSSEGWQLELVTGGIISRSIPTQSTARLLFADPAAGSVTCQAYLEETYQFDLSDYLTDEVLPTQFSLLDTELVFTVD